MERNVFKPYQIKEETATSLCLVETKARKIFLFIFFRIYPVLMLTALAAIIITFDFPLKNKLFLSSLSLFFLWMLIGKSYIEEVYISKQQIIIQIQTFRGKKTKTILTSEIESITVETYLIISSGGFYFRLKPIQSKTQIPLLSIPLLYTNLENRKRIAQKLESITGLRVIKW